jgi:hypothetical protein
VAAELKYINKYFILDLICYAIQNDRQGCRCFRLPTVRGFGFLAVGFPGLFLEYLSCFDMTFNIRSSSHAPNSQNII